MNSQPLEGVQRHNDIVHLHPWSRFLHIPHHSKGQQLAIWLFVSYPMFVIIGWSGYPSEQCGHPCWSSNTVCCPPCEQLVATCEQHPNPYHACGHAWNAPQGCMHGICRGAHSFCWWHHNLHWICHWWQSSIVSHTQCCASSNNPSYSCLQSALRASVCWEYSGPVCITTDSERRGTNYWARPNGHFWARHGSWCWQCDGPWWWWWYVQPPHMCHTQSFMSAFQTYMGPRAPTCCPLPWLRHWRKCRPWSISHYAIPFLPTDLYLT